MNMNISRFFVTTAAAVTVAGAIGFAYAQTATDPRTTSGTADQNRMPNQSGAINDGSTGAMGQGSTGAMSNERMARADRN
jgi:hypothetical protein